MSRPVFVLVGEIILFLLQIKTTDYNYIEIFHCCHSSKEHDIITVKTTPALRVITKSQIEL